MATPSISRLAAPISIADAVGHFVSDGRLASSKRAWVFTHQLNEVRRLRSNISGMGSKVVSFDHHLCHAASAFFLSPFDRALILTMDEEGDGSLQTVRWLRLRSRALNRSRCIAQQRRRSTGSMQDFMAARA